MTASHPKDDAALQRHMVRGSAWIMSVRWSLRILGLISTLILARLLAPADYGVVAIASMIVGVVEVFSRTGQQSALIRLPHPTRGAFRFRMDSLSSLGRRPVGLVIWALTPLTTIYFHEPRAAVVVQILAFRVMLNGAQNIGIVNFQRRLQFNRLFWFNIIPTLISFPVTVTAAFVLRNYWVLVIGLMVEYATVFALSYIMEPYARGSASARCGRFGQFSSWSLVKSIGIYLNDMIDRVAIGGFAGSAAMGRFQVASEVATIPSQEVINPIVSVLFPVMATVQHDHDRRRTLYLAVLYWSALVCMSTSVGVALVSDDFVDLVLGPQWHDMKPLMPWMALSFGVLGMSNSVYTAFDTVGRPLISARLQWLRFFWMAVAIVPVAFLTHDLVSVAITRLVVTITITPVLFLALTQAFGFPFREIVTTIWRPVAAALVMVAAVLSTNAAISFTGPARLFLDAGRGCCRLRR
jgi:O-antigen/teichoic acid export membrane protein